MSRARLAVLLAFVFACTDQNDPIDPPAQENPDAVTLEDERVGHGARDRSRARRVPPRGAHRPLRRRHHHLRRIRRGLRHRGAQPAGREHRAARAGRRRIRHGARGRHRRAQRRAGSGVRQHLVRIVSSGRWAGAAAGRPGAVQQHAVPLERRGARQQRRPQGRAGLRRPAADAIAADVPARDLRASSRTSKTTGSSPTGRASSCGSPRMH